MNIDFYLELIKDYKHQIEINNEYKEKNRKLKKLIKIEFIELLERILNDYALEGYLLDEFITYDIETLLEKAKEVE